MPKMYFKVNYPFKKVHGVTFGTKDDVRNVIFIILREKKLFMGKGGYFSLLAFKSTVLQS